MPPPTPSPPFAIGPALGQFALIALGGAAVGGALGWLTSLLRRRLDELELETAITVLLVCGAYLLAEALDVSGVLAVVVAGYVMGRSQGISTPTTRLGGESFWSVAQFLAESILFLLVGLEFAQLLDDTTRGGWELVGLTALVVAAATLMRAAGWLLLLPLALRVVRRRPVGLAAVTTVGERVVLSVAGLRGALSMAAALTIPVAVDGEAFPERSTVVLVAIASVVVLLVVPALALPAVLHAVGVKAEDDGDEHESRVRAALAGAALAQLEGIGAAGWASEDLLRSARERHVQRRRTHERAAEDPGTQRRERIETQRRIRLETVAAQRRELGRLWRAGDVHGELLQKLGRELDVEDLHRR